MWRQVLSRCWAGRCPVPQGCVPHPWIPAAGRDGGAGKRNSSFQKTLLVFSLAAASWHNHKEEDGEGSQQFWVGKGWQISPQVFPNFHARMCPALALPTGITRMCWHPQAELGHTRTPCAAARWGELGAEWIPGSSFSMVYSYSRYFGALAVITVQHLRQNKSKNLPTTLKSDFE